MWDPKIDSERIGIMMQKLNNLRRGDAGNRHDDMADAGCYAKRRRREDWVGRLEKRTKHARRRASKLVLPDDPQEVVEKLALLPLQEVGRRGSIQQPLDAH